MNKFIKKHASNIIFILLIVLVVYPPTRAKIIGLVSFSPSINKESERETLENYNWSLYNLKTDETKSFNEYKGKVVFVNFWATWCPSCVAEMPMIQSLYNDYKDKVAFLLVSNEEKQKILDYYTENKYNLPAYHSISNPPKNFLKTNAIPYSFLIDKNGKVVIEKTGSANWNSSKVRSLIDNLLKK